MEPPSYEEASRQPPAAAPCLPPSYRPSPSTPPPSYGEAVTVQPDPFPVLTLPVVPTAVTSAPQNPRTTIHPMAQIGAMPPVSGRQPAPVVQMRISQPLPVPVRVTCLTNIPGFVQCPQCHQPIVTKVRRVPGATAWWLCVIIALTGLVCGFCLIPLMVPSLQETRHSCPQCQAHLHTYHR